MTPLWGALVVSALGLGILGAQLQIAKEKLAARPPDSCNCVLLGARDDVVMGFDAFELGRATATPTQNDSLLIPARQACGPIRLNASMPSPGP